MLIVKGIKPKPACQVAKETCKPKPTTSSTMPSTMYEVVRVSTAFSGLYKSCQMAYKIRMGAIQNFGAVIHEYDVSGFLCLCLLHPISRSSFSLTHMIPKKAIL